MRKDTFTNELGSFIDSIASSNLEPLHSKAIAWLLNLPDSPIDLKDFFLSTIFNFDKDSEFEYIITIAEVASHDLLSLVTVNNEFRLVIWENKIKADFHQKKKSQLPLSKKNNIKSTPELAPVNKILEEYETHWLRGISQPFWYQIRWLLWDLQNGNEIKEKIIFPLINKLKNDNQLKNVIEDKLGSTASKMDKNALINYISENIKIDWVILSPHEEKNIKIFHKSQWNGIKSFDNYLNSDQINGDSDLLDEIIKISEHQSTIGWKYITYHQLSSKQTNHKKENAVARAYLNYLETTNYFRNIHFDDGGEQGPQGATGAVGATGADGEKGEAGTNGWKYGMTKHEWDLNHLLKIHSKLIVDDLDFEWLVSGSERNRNPLLNIILSSIPLTKKNTHKLNDILDIPEDVKKSKINEIGIKIQIQGKVKLQFAHRAYHHVKFKKNKKNNFVENYKEFIFQLISQDWNTSFKSKEDRLKFISNNLFSDVKTEYVLKENSPSSKTGLSYTIENPKQRFMNEENVVEIIKAISTYLDNCSFND